MRAIASTFVFVLVLASLAACGDGDDAPGEDAGAGEDGGREGELDISVCQPENGPFTRDVDNPYLPFVIGSHHVLDGLEGGTEPAHFEYLVPDQTLDVAGVTTQVVLKTDTGDPTDAERLYYAQAPDGTVCLFGEDEDGDDQPDWQAGQDGKLAGIFMPGSPAVGMVFEMAHGPDGIERGEITHLGEPTDTPAGTFDDTLTVLEDGPSLKKYARGIGEIYDDGIELISYE